jgi:gliding motility-associated lipoprotein GldD
MRKSVLVLLLVLTVSCKESPQPKPSGFLALNYDTSSFKQVDFDCPFSFEINSAAEVDIENPNRPCWVNLSYPKMKAKIYLTYSPVNNNLRELLIDAQKLPEKHTIKADLIEASIYQNEKNNTSGNFYEVEGDAASQAQFYLTDSTSHFLTGAIYFEAKPNYDSILPAADYLKRDIRHLMETLKWE